MIRKSLVENASAEDMMDDGSDTDDAGQNARFSDQCRNIESTNSYLSKIDIIGVKNGVMDTLWSRSWNGGDPHIPEDIYNHALEYIDNIKKYFNDKKYADLIDKLSSPE